LLDKCLWYTIRSAMMLGAARMGITGGEPTFAARCTEVRTADKNRPS
jgi:hypothetical protein